MSICRNNYRELTAEEVSRFISFIPPDCDYSTEWLYVLMAVHHWSGGSNVGYSICENWCAKGAKYNKAVLLEKWQSFKKNDGIYCIYQRKGICNDTNKDGPNRINPISSRSR